MNVVLDHISLRDAPRGFAIVGHRILLDRSYVELEWEGEPLVFLRPEPGGEAALREAASLLGREPKAYTGRDGEWLDVELAGPVALTVRVDRDDWPPARPDSPRLSCVRLRGDAAALLDPLEVLGGPPEGLVVDHAPGDPLKLTGYEIGRPG